MVDWVAQRQTRRAPQSQRARVVSGYCLRPRAGISRDRTKPPTHTFSLTPAARATKVGFAKHRAREAASVYGRGRGRL